MIENEFAPIVMIGEKEDKLLDKVLVKAKEFAKDVPIAKEDLCIISNKSGLEKTHSPYVVFIWGGTKGQEVIGDVDYDKVYTMEIEESTPVVVIDIKNPVKGIKKVISIYKERIK